MPGRIPVACCGYPSVFIADLMRTPPFPSAWQWARFCAGLGGLLPGVVMGQAVDDLALQEVVVTGERLSRPMSETASSVVVFTADMNEALAGADRIEDVLALVPNVQSGSGGEGPTIRGQDSTGVLRDLPAFLGGTRPRVTLQVDGRAVSFNEFVFGLASVWDVDRIEVFRSPQTTTQGRNSIGGAIFIESQDPAYAWEGRVRMLGGNYDTWQASGVVSGPLVDDQLAVRIAGDLRRSRTFSRIKPLAMGADPNRNDYGLVRIKLLAEPKAVPGMRLLTTYTHVDSQMPQVEGVRNDLGVEFEDRVDNAPTYGVFSNDVDSLTSVLDYRLAPALDSTTTLSFGDARIERFAPPGLGQTQTHSRDFSAESVLRWVPDQPVRALGGAHYLRSRLDQDIDLSAVLGKGSFSDEQQSLGLFGELTFRPTPRLPVTAGIRYQRDSQDRQGLLGTSGSGYPIDFDQAFDAWLPKLSVAYEIGKDFNLGVLVQRAYNPGGTTLNLDTGEQDEFGAETLWNYELFVRTSFAGGRVTLDANVFYNDFEDAQRSRLRAYTVPGGATAFWAEIDNMPRAESHGLEIDLGWHINATLVLRAGLGLLDTRIVEPTPALASLRGNEFQRSPAVTASAAIDWRPVAGWRLSAQGRHNSDYYSDDANTPGLAISGTTVLDARASYEKGQWQVFGYVRNVFDRFYLMSLNSNVRGTAGDPRQYGLGFELRY
jgi:iron complex outermembrane recepter protein